MVLTDLVDVLMDGLEYPDLLLLPRWALVFVFYGLVDTEIRAVGSSSLRSLWTVRIGGWCVLLNLVNKILEDFVTPEMEKRL